MMKRIGALLAVLLLISATAGFAQSLGELAKKEKERREKLKAQGKTITDVDTAKFKGGAISTAAGTPAAAPAEAPPDAKVPPEGNPKTGAEAASGDEAVDLQGRPESFWRQTLGDAREKVTALENEANVLVLRFTDLQNRFYREDNGFRQQQIQQEMQKTLYEQDLNRQELAKARQQLQDLETEARKSGALPGWLKPDQN